MANYYALRGEILMYEKRYRRALNYLKKSLKIRQALLNPIHPDIAMTFNHIGHCHFKLNKLCWLPFLLSNIAKIYKNKKIGDLCLKYGQKIAVDTPRLIDDVNLPELTNSDVTTSEQKLDTEIIPEIRITLVGTSDMRKPLMCLSEKVRSLIDYYSNEVPSISFSCYFQGCENSHEIFETLMCQSTMKNFSELFVGLIWRICFRLKLSNCLSSSATSVRRISRQAV